MHLLDEILTPSVWISGYAGAAVAATFAIRRLTPEAVPKVAVVTSAFVVASYVHVPLPVGTSVHLTLNGLVGILLGVEALPAIAVALLLHTLGGHGGIQPLGFMMLALGSGALLGKVVFHVVGGRDRAMRKTAAAFLAGGLAVYWSSFVVFLGLWLAGEPVQAAARVYLVAHAGLAVVEGIVTAATVSFLCHTKPEIVGDVASETRSPVIGCA